MCELPGGGFDVPALVVRGLRGERILAEDGTGVKLRHALATMIWLGWERIRGRAYSKEDIQEWIHERGWCLDPLCPYLLEKERYKL